MKYVTRILILFAIFACTVFYMGTNMPGEQYKIETTEKQEESTFPIVSVLGHDMEFDMMYGYSGNLPVTNFRDTIIPLGPSKLLEFQIRENEVEVKKVSYEVIELTSKKQISSGTMSALEENKVGKVAKFKLEGDYESGTEYALTVTVVTDKSKKIHYYARIKYLDQSVVKEQLSFILGFHNATFDEEEFTEKYASYLDQRTYLNKGKVEYLDAISKVNSYSPPNLITWNKMKPKRISKVIPSIKEVNIDTISVELQYLIEGTVVDEDGTEFVTKSMYEVSEFYRIRYTPSKTYLLSYYRTMDAILDKDNIEIKTANDGTKEINLGISQQKSVEMKVSEGDKQVAFVNHGTLYYYDLTKNKLVEVYTLMDRNAEFFHGGYNENNIRILNINSAGNMDFIVSGYINRGDYEGRIGMVLYKYYAEDNRIEEQAYIPLEYPNEILEKKIGDFNYLSSLNVFYFSIDNAIYAYNIETHKLDILSEDVTSKSVMMSPKGKFVVWQNASEPTKSTSIKVLNMETEQSFTIDAPKGNNIVLLGQIHHNFAYGLVKTKDIVTSTDGTIVTPVHTMFIVDVEGTVLKQYEPKGNYVSSVTVNENTLSINLVKKDSDGKNYHSAGQDYIVNKIEESKSEISCISRTLTKDMDQFVLVLPKSLEVSTDPKAVLTNTTIITEDTTVHIQPKETKERVYYAIGRGHIIGQYQEAKDAIAAADAMMGVAVNESNLLIWERGEKSLRSSISSLSEINAGNGVTSIGACISMLLKYNYIQVDAKELSKRSESMLVLLDEYLEGSPVNLTKSTLEQVLYYVSENRPVIAMKGKNHAVVLTGYDEISVTYYDPSEKRIVKLGMSAAEKLFDDAGNVFVSYVK